MHLVSKWKCNWYNLEIILTISIHETSAPNKIRYTQNKQKFVNNTT